MDLSEWKEAVTELNVQFSSIDESRDKIYKWLAEEIKELFFKYTSVYPKVFFTNDARIIEVRVSDSDISSVHIHPDLFREIGMKFSIIHKFNENADYCLCLRFYPFEELEE